MRKAIFAAVVLALPRLASAGGVDWIVDDYDKAMAKAKESGKLVHVHWGADWCHWCHELEDKTLAVDAVRDYMNETFVNLKVDKDKFEQLAQKFHVSGIPDTQFLTSEGRVVKRIVGYLPADEFLAEVRKAPEAGKKLVELEEAVKKDDKDAASRLELGRILSGAGEADASSKHLRAVTDLDKDNAKGLASEAWYLLADAQFNSDDPDIVAAKEALAKVSELDPKNEKGRTDNAAAKLAFITMQSDPALAKKEFEKVLADYPKTDGAGEAMFMIGAIQADAEQDFDGAEATFKKLEAEMPEDAWAKKVPTVLKQLDEMRQASKKGKNEPKDKEPVDDKKEEVK